MFIPTPSSSSSPGADITATSVAATPVWVADFVRGRVPQQVALVRASAGGRFNANGLYSMLGVNLPRLDNTPDGLALRGLLMEGQRTNLVTQSHNLATTWQLNAAGTSVSQTITAPDGSTGYALSFSANAVSGLYMFPGGFTAGTKYTYSVYAKYVSGNGVIQFGSDSTTWGTGTQAAHITFNTQTGSVSSVSSGVSAHSITPVGNGWYRLTVTATLASGNSPSVMCFHGVWTAGVVGLWGYQVEAGSHASSLMPTSGTSATRTGDIATIVSAANIGMHPKEGTLLVELEAAGVDTGTEQRLLQLDNGTNTTCMTLGLQGGALSLWTTVASVTQGSLSGPSTTTGTIYKVAAAWNGSQIALAVNGGTVAVNGSTGGVASPAYLRIGGGAAGSQPMHGWVRRVAYYPARLGDGQLRYMTT